MDIFLCVCTDETSAKRLFGYKLPLHFHSGNDVESKWDSWYEESNGEADYDDEYDAMKSFVKGDVDWKSVKSEYFDYIEETNNEDDYDSKFRKFKSFVKKNLNNKFIKESFELEGDFLNDCYLELSDLGFEFKISSNSISGELNGKYKFDEVIDLYRDFILRIEFEFHVKEHNISFKENGVEIEVNLIEKTLEGLKDSIKIKLDGEEKIGSDFNNYIEYLKSKNVPIDAQVRNPETGKDIKVGSALKYDKKSPAYKAATSLVAMLNKK